MRFVSLISLVVLFFASACEKGLRESNEPTVSLQVGAKSAEQSTTPQQAPRSGAQKQSLESSSAPPRFSFLNEAGRSAEDRALDGQRQPLKTLKFYGIGPKMRVADLAAGGGYTTELLARAVGPEGVVYGQNSPFILKHFAEVPWSARLEKEALKNVVRIDTEFDAPLTHEASNLDAVLMVLFYHDTVWFKTDRMAMNEAIFASLKPGGVYGIIDHASASGMGTSQAKSLHRIEESVVVSEVEAAGFQLEDRALFLGNSEDKRDWNASPSAAGQRRGQSDRFVLRFVKPLSSERAPHDVAPKGKLTACKNPRPQVCTREYAPVCGVIDTGVRCVRAPCPSQIYKTFGNACTACADESVTGHHPGPCPRDGVK